MQELDDLFAAARQTPAQMPDRLTRAIMADAVTARTGTVVPEPEMQIRPRLGRWRQLILAIGGLPALGGLAVAGLRHCWWFNTKR